MSVVQKTLAKNKWTGQDGSSELGSSRVLFDKNTNYSSGLSKLFEVLQKMKFDYQSEG
jgi:hypothetical protein